MSEGPALDLTAARRTNPGSSERGFADRSPQRSRLARGLGLASATVACVLLPVLMAVANKSAPAVLGVAAVLAIAAALVAIGPRRFGGKLGRVVVSGTGRALTVLVVVSVLSLLWTIDPAMTRRGLVEALPELLCAWALAAAWPLLLGPRHLRLLVVGLVGAVAVIAFEAIGGMIFHKYFGARAESYDLKRSVIPLVLLLWPTTAYLTRTGHRPLAAVLVVLVATVAVLAHSSASILAVALGVGVLLAARWLPRVTYWSFASVLAVLLTLAPWTGTISAWLMSPRTEALLHEQHASARIQIWSAFERHIRDKHLIGHGFDGSFRVADIVENVSATFGPGADKAIDNIHPHNVLLQVWIEFGVLGAALTAVAIVFVFARIAALDERRRATRLAFLASAGLCAMVGLNAWSPWWLAVLALSLNLFTVEKIGPNNRGAVA